MEFQNKIKIHRLAKIYAKSTKWTSKIRVSYATYRNFQSRLKERAIYSPLGGGVLMLDLLSKSHHKINLIMNEDLIIDEDGVPLLWITCNTASLST